MAKKENKENEVENLLLATKICDCISDGYDDEEYREESEKALYTELKKLSRGNILKAALTSLCERIEELE